MAVVTKRSTGEIVFCIFNMGVLIFLCVSILYPIFNVISLSLSGYGPVARGEITFYPKDFTLDPFREVFKTPFVLTAYRNTLFITLSGTFLGVILTSFVAYPLSRPNFMARRFFTLCIALTLWFNAGIIPTFMVVRSLALYNSLWAIIIPSLVNTFNTIVMLTFFKSIPQDLIDAADVDGCNEFRKLFQIVYPVSKPILATIALWIAVALWNNFFESLLYLRDRNLYPLQIILREILLQGRTDIFFLGTKTGESEFKVVDESLKGATVVAATLPILFVYPFLQKYFAKGVMIGSIKG